jgi:hypothetical protein
MAGRSASADIAHRAHNPQLRGGKKRHRSGASEVGNLFCDFRISLSNPSLATDPDRDTGRGRGLPARSYPRRLSGASIAAWRGIHSTMRSKTILALASVCLTMPLSASNVAVRPATAASAAATPPKALTAQETVEARVRADLAAMRAFRPGYVFWRHVFTTRDGSIAFGSAVDGRLLATFPAKGDWTRDAIWADASIAGALAGYAPARKLKDRREDVVRLLEGAAGPVLHNSTRGDALLGNVPKYGPFLAEWGAIYERFGVPADIGLAQVILESGLSGTRRSHANAIGFCQWQQKNWRRLNYFSPVPIQERNQTTQAPYCAAYLTVLAAKYGSFIPALSEHNAGGTNVGRALITGEYLGADDVRARYLLGSRLARDLRALPGREYEEVYRSYGPRSFLYAEMVFGNTSTVTDLMASTPQQPIRAMRTSRALPLREVIARTGLAAADVRRFNPALTERVPAGAMIYLPDHVADFGSDVAFWRSPPSPSYTAVLDDFLRLAPGAERWDDPAFAPVLSDFKRRFSETNTEEGMVMATVLAYAMDQAFASPRRTLLAEYRESAQVRTLIDRGVVELEAARRTTAPAGQTADEELKRD